MYKYFTQSTKTKLSTPYLCSYWVWCFPLWIPLKAYNPCLLTTCTDPSSGHWSAKGGFIIPNHNHELYSHSPHSHLTTCYASLIMLGGLSQRRGLLYSVWYHAHVHVVIICWAFVNKEQNKRDWEWKQLVFILSLLHILPHVSCLTLQVLVVTIDAQWEVMVDVGSALLPPCPTIRVLSYSN